MLYILPILLIAAITVPFILLYKNRSSAKTARKYIVANLVLFAVVCLSVVALPIGLFATSDGTAAPMTTTAAPSAQDTAADAETATATTGRTVGDGLAFISAALAVGLSCVGGGIAVANSASAAIGATGENPANFVRSLIFVALAEGVALYGFIIAIQIIGKL